MRYLFVLVWLAVMAVIFGTGLLLARRAPHSAPTAAGAAGTGPQAAAGSHEAASGGFFEPRWLVNSARLIVIAVLGGVAVYGVMALLGVLVVNHGLVIDRPILHWVDNHQVHAWAAVMNRLTKIGDTWTCWAAAITAAVCLSVSWRTKRWLPPIVLSAAIVVDHFTTQALRHTFHRLGPPASPFGTYPSGGCDRCILFFGLIAYLLWREFSGQRRTAIWAGAVVAALGVNEAYSRIYLSLHWFTDALSGLLYGCLLLAVFIVAIRIVAGPGGARPLAAGHAAGGRRRRQPAAHHAVTAERTENVS